MTALTDLPGWAEYQQRKERLRLRVAKACGDYQDAHPDELRELKADERRQAKREARHAAGKFNEHEEQCLVVEWLEARGHELFAVPNGQVIGLPPTQIPRYAAYLKREGKRRGVPDLVISPPRGNRVCTALEMKAIGGTVSDEQHAWLDRLENWGWRVLVGYGADDAIRKLEEAGY